MSVWNMEITLSNNVKHKLGFHSKAFNKDHQSVVTTDTADLYPLIPIPSNKFSYPRAGR